jgi:hypothetical protein
MATKISNALFKLTRNWTRTPDGDDVASKCGCSPAESIQTWVAITESRAQHATEYLQATAGTDEGFYLGFPSGNNCWVTMRGDHMGTTADDTLNEITEDEDALFCCIDMADLVTLWEVAKNRSKFS